MDANRHLSGNCVVLINFKNSIVSLRYEVSFFTYGCNHRSTNWDMGSVMLLQLDTIGLRVFVNFFQEIKSGCECLLRWFTEFKPCLF